MLDADPKRTGVPARKIEWSEPPCHLVDDRWHAEPGDMIPVEGGGVAGFLIACPGCGQLGTAREGASWAVTGGSTDDVTTLTLWPSILKSCCGWHGYLVHGVFEVCG